MAIGKGKKKEISEWLTKALFRVIPMTCHVAAWFAPPQKQKKLRVLLAEMDTMSRDAKELFRKMETANGRETLDLLHEFEDQHREIFSDEQWARNEAFRAKLRNMDAENDAIKAIIHTHGNNTEAAISELHAYIAAHPNSHHAYSYLGVVFQNRKQWNESIAAYETAERLAQKEDSEEGASAVSVAMERLSIGDILQEKGDLKAAIAQYQRLINVPPAERNFVACLAYLHMGNALQKLNRHSEARAAWKNAIKHDDVGPVAKAAREKLKEKA